MSQITFYPGPSRVYSRVPEFIYQAQMDGMMSINHRSTEFMDLMAQTKKTLHKNLGLPSNYQIIFTSSATEMWEVVGQSLVQKSSQHFYNGAFGEKWASVLEKLDKKVIKTPFQLEEELPVDKLDTSTDCVCITHNETSNGTMVSDAVLTDLSEKLSNEQLLVVDATSSLGGVEIDLKLADIWFASVQKCFGLPPGLGVVFVSEKAIQRAQEINERRHYNSLLAMLEHSAGNQTHYTPNVLAIYLLWRTQNKAGAISEVAEKVLSRYRQWQSFIEQNGQLDFLIENKDVRSQTVLTLTCTDTSRLKQLCKDAGFTLGNGYGQWKETTFRIANFPAIRGMEIHKLQEFLSRNLSVF